MNRIVDYLLLTQSAIPPEGDNIVIAIKVARELLPAPGPLVPDAVNVRDPGFVQVLLAKAIQHLKASMNRELAISKDFNAWNQQTPNALLLAKLYGLYYAIAAFNRVLTNMGLEEDRITLQCLLHLFSIHELEQYAGWLSGEQLTTTLQWKELLFSKNQLLDRVIPLLPRLEAALAVPDNVLQAPVAADDYIAAVCRLEEHFVDYLAR
ncbi:acyl-CoA dehydrogenase [Paraflavitalea speifideaquila]|uniref:acyl-CoA dehydrogenase n=1 Tax=Paraflavitalea speifideaquila TaxID=3076558 RepID=UPI0028EC70D3|nr:acyl-CoA dehydrogenase [Paraflavitalea speifideiaquila]